MLALCLMYFTQAYGFYFNITWLPTYLARDRGLTSERWGSSGLLAGLPLILSSVADVLGGLTTDAITRKWGLRAGRCGVGRRLAPGRRAGADRRGDGPRPDRLAPF